MHAHEIVELAALVAAQGPTSLHRHKPLQDAQLQRYWTASKCRLERWGRELGAISLLQQGLSLWRPRRPQRFAALIEEVFTADMLARVATALLCVHDQRHQTNQAEPIARSVFAGHVEARHRALKLLLRVSPHEGPLAENLDLLRRRCERYSDMLVGSLGAILQIDDFAHDAERAHDFTEDFKHRHDSADGSPWPLIIVSLREAFPVGDEPSPNADLNAAVAGAVLSCCVDPPTHTTNPFRNFFCERLLDQVDEVSNLLDNLGADQHQTAPSAQ